LTILALDLGERWVGVAVSDPSDFLASPFKTVEVTKAGSLIEEILQIVEEKGVEKIVVGLPISMAGSWNNQTKSVNDFIIALSAYTDVPIFPVDERLSTVEAERRLIESGHRMARSKQRIDAVAATIILQAFLDSQRMT